MIYLNDPLFLITIFTFKIYHWEQRKLGEENTITMGQSPSSKNYTDNPNDWILIQGNADLKDGKVSPRIYTSQITKKADIGDIILTVRAPVGEVAITDYNAVLGRGVAAIKGTQFIYYALEKFKENNKWNTYSSGSTFDSITGRDLNNLVLSFPSELERNKIGILLKKLDSILTLYERKIKVINSIIDYFKQQLFNKDSNLTFPNSCWSNIKIKNLYTRRREKNTDVLYAQNKIISVANMKFAKKSVNSSKEYLKTYFITHSNDIIYEGNRSGNFKYGRFVQNDLGDGIVSHVFTVYKPVKELDWNFMKSFINYEPIMSKILLYATTDTLMMHTLHDKELMKQQLCLPDIGTQNKIGNFLKSIQNINNLYLEKLEHLNKIKKLLLNTMFI